MKAFFLIIGFLAMQTAGLEAQDNKKKKQAPRRPNPALQPVEDDSSLPRVLLIGDSISIGYTTGVRELLKGKANVHRPLTNCGPTTKGVAEIDQWLQTGGKDKKWDVIHFNWGLHDLKYMGPNGENLADPAAENSAQQVSADAYAENLDLLVTQLKATGAKLIWRNTTPVPPGAKGRMVGDSAKYNEVAAAVMEKHGIPTHDLFTVAKDRMDELMMKANVHFHKDGNKVLSKEVADRIVKEL
ncbi:MAG: SGNH/GDSL hydrolase family protein [Verrucomicrobiota bacterium]